MAIRMRCRKVEAIVAFLALAWSITFMVLIFKSMDAEVGNNPHVVYHKIIRKKHSQENFTVSAETKNDLPLYESLDKEKLKHPSDSVVLSSFAEREITPLSETIHKLKQVSAKFYIYTDYMITQELVLEVLRLQGQMQPFERAGDILKYSRADRIVLRALEKHPLRTENPEEASYFIIPTPVSELLLYGCRTQCKRYDQAFAALKRQKTFQKTRGHNHIIVSTGLFSFNKYFSFLVEGLYRNYMLLENVTVATHYDPFAAIDLAKKTRSMGAAYDFNVLFPFDGPVSKAFSIGMGQDAPLALQTPSYERFHHSKYFICYHGRDTEEHRYLYSSNVYREAAWELRLRENNLPLSSIEHELDEKTWTKRLGKSKFCLVVRGDRPHSEELLYAVRAGCIPVVVSDYFQEYASPFKSSVDMEDFCIFIKELDFRNDAKKEIFALQDLSEETIKEKIRNLAMVQKIIFPDHPDSLFVEAFLTEAIQTNDRFAPGVQTRKAVEMGESKTTISGEELTYRYPMSLTYPRRSDSINGADVIVGLLSAAGSLATRTAIRSSWAEKYRDRVFFLVSGSWSDIEEEFYEQGDLFWVDMPDHYFLLTYKVQVFFHAVEAHADSYDYVFKTDDDSFVGLPEVSRILGEAKPHFWGHCVFTEEARIANRDPTYTWYTPESLFPDKYYPVYAQGAGYGLSREFVKCLTPKLAENKFMPWEDAATGLLAQQCSPDLNVQCQDTEYDQHNNNRGRKCVEHKINAEEIFWWYKRETARQWIWEATQGNSTKISDLRKGVQ